MDLYEVFEKLNIVFEEKEHQPVTTIEEALMIADMIEGLGTKCLFLQDKKKHYYLLIAEENKRINIKEIAHIVGKSSLSFASAERLMEVMGLEAGSVTPFGIINDADKKVTILIDEELKNQKLLFHPNTNCKTISVEFDDLIKFIDFEEHSYLFFQLENEELFEV